MALLLARSTVDEVPELEGLEAALLFVEEDATRLAELEVELFVDENAVELGTVDEADKADDEGRTELKLLLFDDETAEDDD